MNVDGARETVEAQAARHARMSRRFISISILLKHLNQTEDFKNDLRAERERLRLELPAQAFYAYVHTHQRETLESLVERQKISEGAYLEEMNGLMRAYQRFQ